MKYLKFVICILICMVLLSGCEKEKSLLQVHFIDVGQGDSTLIVTPQGNTILIDAGNNSKGDRVESYIRELGIEDLDIVVATHPDADHIGGMDHIIYNFDIRRFYMTKKNHSSKSFNDVLTALSRRDVKIGSSKYGSRIKIEEGVHMDFLGPDHIYDDNNKCSIVARIRYGDSSFLFMGDAETENEDVLLDSKYDMSSDVLKLGHHGSSSSSSEKFLRAVSPGCAIISCGYENPYGHPHKETLDLMDRLSIAVFRTDMQGDIVVYSDGSQVWSKVKPYSD